MTGIYSLHVCVLFSCDIVANVAKWHSLRNEKHMIRGRRLLNEKTRSNEFLNRYAESSEPDMSHIGCTAEFEPTSMKTLFSTCKEHGEVVYNSNSVVALVGSWK